MSSQEQFSNNAFTTLGADLGSAATSMTVASGTGTLFPNISGSQYFTCTLFASGSDTETPNEIVKVTAKSGDTFTIVRGQEGTTPQNWTTGDNVGNFPTVGWANNVAQAGDVQLQPGNYAADTGTANAGVVTMAPAIASLAALVGVPIRVLKIASPNLNAYTLNVNGLGAKAVVLGGTPLEAGQLSASQVFEVIYNGTNFDLVSPPTLVYNDGLAQMPLGTVKANITGGAAAPQDVPLATFLAQLTAGVAGSIGNMAISILGIVVCVHDFSISGQTTITVPHGNSHIFSSWARCWMAGDDSNQDVSTSCVAWNVNYGTIYSHSSGTVNCWMGSIGQ